MRALIANARCGYSKYFEYRSIVKMGGIIWDNLPSFSTIETDLNKFGNVVLVTVEVSVADMSANLPRGTYALVVSDRQGRIVPGSIFLIRQTCDECGTTEGVVTMNNGEGFCNPCLDVLRDA